MMLASPALRKPSKSVHFNSLLEIRPFFSKQSPSSVKPRSYYLPTTSRLSTDFSGLDLSDTLSDTCMSWVPVPSYTKTIVAISDKSPVTFCGLHISNKRRTMVGYVAVANIAYHKSVMCLFTFDNWRTVSTVAAVFIRHAESQASPLGYDWFAFDIDISGIFDLQSRTCLLCVRYLVDGQEYWDNNGGTNFRVSFQRHGRRHQQQNTQDITDRVRSSSLISTGPSILPAILGTSAPTNKENTNTTTAATSNTDIGTRLDQIMSNHVHEENKALALPHTDRAYMSGALQATVPGSPFMVEDLLRTSTSCNSYKMLLERYCFVSSTYYLLIEQLPFRRKL